MNRSEVWLICLDPTVGSEIQKTRPAVIVSDNAIGLLPLKVIVPITDWKDKYIIAPWMVKINPDSNNGLTKLSSADTFQVRSVAQERFVKKLGTLDNTIMNKITTALSIVLSINTTYLV